MTPRLIYDGECGFCRYLVAYAQATTADQVEYRAYQDVASEHPEISAEEFAASIQLVDASARRDGAHAAFATLAIGGKTGWLKLYEHVPGFAWLTELLYTLVSSHRNLFFHVAKPLFGPTLAPRTHNHVADLLIRGIGLCAVFAFVSLWRQAQGLIGHDGILPYTPFLEAIGDHFGAGRFWWHPTVLWLNDSAAAMHATFAVGTLAALFLVAGKLRFTACVVGYLAYLSIMNVGQTFTAFQWDILLVECLIAAAVAARVPTLGVWIVRLLLFRFMLLSGAVKLLSGDPTWADGSALAYHFETQPLPNVLAWYAHQLPAGVLESGVWATFAIELALPFFIFLPRRPRMVAATGFVFLELLILLTGSYNFFNLLTIVLCIALLDDDQVPRRLAPIASATQRRRLAKAMGVVIISLGLLTTIASLQRHPLSTPLSPWRLANSYGLFAVMTTERYELTIEGSLDGLEWKAYGFPYKPTDPAVAPRLATPHQPRLDWQMWFAALGQSQHASWIYNLAFALLEGRAPVLELMDDPFEGEPPTFIRIRSERYTFTNRDERAVSGNWWNVGPSRIWLEPIRLRRPVIRHEPLELN